MGFGPYRTTLKTTVSSSISETYMKKIKRLFESGNVVINTSPEIKMSELIEKYAADYINMGETTEERQNYLNGACTAWNIANLDEKDREEAIRRVMEDHKRMNPGTDDAEDFVHDLRILIQKKLEVFPNIQKIIVDARIEPISEKKFKINIASTYNKELVRRFFKRI
jgi:hypothetical protein